LNTTGEGFHKIKDISSTKISNPRKAVPIQDNSYERLEFLGDAIIHAILAEYIFKRYPDQQEGFMTKLRTKLENSETLAKFTQTIGLDNFILLSKSMEEMNWRNSNVHVLEDVFEAFIGAMYIDGEKEQYDNCKKIVVQLVENEIDIAEIISNDTNYKDILLRHVNKKKYSGPEYGTQSVMGDESKIYEMYVKVNGEIVGTGTGDSKRKGEQNAARIALIFFKEIRDDDDSSEEECDYEYEEH
jgi:dsRNA-specific ribonuclease